MKARARLLPRKLVCFQEHVRQLGKQELTGVLGRSVGYIYGPVPSRRLGQSLGVDPIPFKVCNYNCVYCQLGRTRPLTNARRDFFDPEHILDEVKTALARRGDEGIDYITFVGQGEPLLCASLGQLIRGVKAMSELPVAVITNGSLLFLADVREELIAADVVMPSLDAGEEMTFRRVNRPWPALRLGEIIAGMAAFRREFHGQLWVEVMLIKGLNDEESTLLQIRDALKDIQPDQVHINIPIRPPAERWVEPPDEQGLIRALAILGEAATVVAPYQGTFQLAEDIPLLEAIVEVIRRHPMRETEIFDALSGQDQGRVRAALEDLAACGRAQRIEYRGHAFWRYAGRLGS